MSSYVRIHVVGGMSFETETVTLGDVEGIIDPDSRWYRRALRMTNRRTNRDVVVATDKVTIVEEFDE